MDDDNKKKSEDMLNEEEEVRELDEEATEPENVEEASEQDARIAELEKQLESEKAGKLRALADYQNLKVRTAREKEELLQYGQTALLLKLLDIADDFRNIIENAKDTADEAWFGGVIMVYEKIKNIIASEGAEVIDANTGDAFDPAMHEAIGFTTVQEEENDQKIASIVSQGYKVKGTDKLIRPARVIVNKKQ